MKIIIKGTPKEISRLKKKLTRRKTLKFKSVDGRELAEYITKPLEAMRDKSQDKTG